MIAIKKYIQNKRFEKYLKLKQEFSYLEQPMIKTMPQEIKQYAAVRYVDMHQISEEQWSMLLDYYKSSIARELADKIVQQYMTIKICDSPNCQCTKIIRGTVYVALKKGA